MLQWFTNTLLWSAPLSRKQTWPFYLSITWLLLHKEFFLFSISVTTIMVPFLSSLTLSSLVLLCSFSLIDFLLAFSLVCPLGYICSFSKADTYGLGEEELVSCFLSIRLAVPGALWCLFFLLDHSRPKEVSTSGAEQPQTPMCSVQFTVGPLWLGKVTLCLWRSTYEYHVNLFLGRMYIYSPEIGH